MLQCVCICVCTPLPPPHPPSSPSHPPSQPHRCSSEPVPGRPSQWQHQQGQGWHEEGPPAPPEEHQCSGAEVAHQDQTEGSCSCGGEGNPEGTKDLVFNPFISGSTCACYSSIPTLCHLTLNLCLFVQSFVINTLCCLLFVLFVYCIDLRCVEPCA